MRDPIITRIITILALAASCTDDGPSGPGIEGNSHVQSYYLPAVAASQIDILFVIDDTTAMAPHQQALAGLPASVQQVFAGSDTALASYHLGVVTTDAASGGDLRRSSAVSDAFIVHDQTFSGMAPNYQGSLTDAFASLMPNSAASTAANRPLETMQLAFADSAQNAGFLRDDAYLGIVAITASDDASSAAAADYASAVKALKSDPVKVYAIGVYDLSAPRLGEFFAQFPNRNESHSIEDGDFGAALAAFTQLYKSTLGYSCVTPPADLDPDAPGPQVDCAFVSIAEDGSEQRLPMCGGATAGPCWEIVDADPQICSYPPDTGHLQTRGFTTSTSPDGDPFHPTIRGECIVN